jgi:hypothetical protein
VPRGLKQIARGFGTEVLAMEPFLRLPAAHALETQDGARALAWLAERLAVCWQSFLSPDEISQCLTAVYTRPHDWTAGFGGEQFGFGEVWYHYREEGLPFELYSERANASNDLIQHCLPWLYPKILNFAGSILSPGEVYIRRGWAGPAIVIFPANGRCAKLSGDRHFDWDGLEPRDLIDSETQAFTFVSMLSRPAEGGGLRMWPLRFEPPGTAPLPEPVVDGIRYYDIDYLAGDLWMFPSLLAHQILSFSGDTDRVCLTFHAVRREKDWAIWF